MKKCKNMVISVLIVMCVCLVNSKVVRADESNFKKVLGKSTIDINDQYKIQDENQEGLLNFFTAYFEKNLVP